MSCGLLKALLTKLFVTKDMKSSPSSSKKSARRQSKQVLTPDSPSQNTRLARKRRLDQQRKEQVQALQSSSNNEQQAQQQDPPLQRLDSSLNTMAVPSTFVPMDSFMSQWMAANTDISQHEMPRPYVDDIFSDIAAPLTMADESMPTAGVYHDMFPSHPLEDHPGADDVLMTDWDADLDLDMTMLSGTAKPTTTDLVCGDCQVPAGQSKHFLCTALASAAKLADFSTLERADSATAEQTRQAIHFLELPLEIRRHIYIYVLPAVVGRPYTRNGKSAGYVKGTCDILRVNKQLYLECKDLLNNSMVFEFDVGYSSISLNTTQKTGIWNQPKSKNLRADGRILRLETVREVVTDVSKETVLEDFRIEAARQVVINVPDVISLEDWESLERHQKAVKEDGAVALKEPFAKLLTVLASCHELQHVQINLRDWDEKVETAFALLEPVKRLLAPSSCSSLTVPRVILYKLGWTDWPWTNHELVNEWQLPVRSRDVHRYTLTLREDGELQATVMERASVAKIPVKEDVERS